MGDVYKVIEVEAANRDEGVTAAELESALNLNSDRTITAVMPRTRGRVWVVMMLA